MEIRKLTVWLQNGLCFVEMIDNAKSTSKDDVSLIFTTVRNVRGRTDIDQEWKETGLLTVRIDRVEAMSISDLAERSSRREVDE